MSYHRARDACRNDWHPLCGKGGALQGRLLHDGIGVRIAEQWGSGSGSGSGSTSEGRLPLRWLVPLPRQLLPPCEPTHPWALPKQPPMAADEEGDDDEGLDDEGQGDLEGNDPGAGSCQLHSSGGGAGTFAAAASRESHSRAAERLAAVSGADEIQTMLTATDAADSEPAETESTIEEEAWREELEEMACGSPHAGDPLIEQPAEGLPSAESQAGGEQRGVTVVDWGSHAESGRRPFTEWAVEGGVPVLLKGTDLTP